MDAIEATLRQAPSAGLLLVVLMAWLEFVFPPVPGDTTILLGFFLAGLGLLSVPAVAAASLAGSVAGALTAWAIGRRAGRSYFFLRSRWARGEMDRLRDAFARHGAKLLLLNRFLPGVRGLFLYAAGGGGIALRPALIWSTASNVLWIALVGFAGLRLGSSWDEVRLLFRRYVWVVAIAVTAYLAVSIVRQRRRRRAGGGAS
ncbi:MAG: DedA family protein [Candidatus Polarisedimenticolia bacterium]